MAQLPAFKSSPEDEATDIKTESQEWVVDYDTAPTCQPNPGSPMATLLHMDSTDSTQEWKEVETQRETSVNGATSETPPATGTKKGGFLFLLLPILFVVVATLLVTSGNACHFPGSQSLAICVGNKSIPTEDKVPALNLPEVDQFRELLMIQSSSFEAAFDTTLESAGLKLQLRASEGALDDLVTAVKNSDMEWKHETIQILEKVVAKIKKASKIYRDNSIDAKMAIDGLIMSNEHTLRLIEKAKARDSTPVNKVQRAIGLYKPQTPRIMEVAYRSMIEDTEDRLKTIIQSGRLAEDTLVEALEMQSELFSIINRQNTTIVLNKEEVLASLWTFFGGNKAAIKKFDENLRILSWLDSSQKDVKSHIRAALHVLESDFDQLEVLHRTVATPLIVDKTIPVEIHVTNIIDNVEMMISKRSTINQREDAVYEFLRKNGASATIEG